MNTAVQQHCTLKSFFSTNADLQKDKSVAIAKIQIILHPRHFLESANNAVG